IVFDLFTNLTDFIEGKTPLGDVFLFYLILVPRDIWIIAPISLLLAILYALWQLSRANEITAMRACGLSSPRIMRPIMLLGLVATLVVGTINETLGPWAGYWTEQFLKLQHTKNAPSVYIVSPLAFKNEVGRRVWYIREFDKRTFEMRDVTLTQQRPDGSDDTKYQAARGAWLDGRWWFSEVATQLYDEQSQPRIGFPATFTLQREMTEVNEKPENFLNEVKPPEYLSSLEILTYISAHRQLSHDALAKCLTNFHNRLSMPWICVIVAFIGIPFGVKTGNRRGGALLAIVGALALVFGFYVLSNIGVALGKQGQIVPWVAGWLPNFIFLGIGITLTARMR
ncbi:MAG: LptF/LptG family permease, partial [Kiritimatiellaeota bacterium]|nr:LptF/LptG family permease [Kiritimatiellota bacterium]